MSRFRPTISDRVPSGTHFAELYLSPGPEHIGVTGDNRYQTMYGYDWLLVWDRDDGLLHLYQERDGAWHEVLDDLPPVFGVPVPEGSRRWSFTFDQSARAVTAYEDADGIIRATRWDPAQNQYIQNVSFPGFDPCVVIDASWSFSVPGSDVLLFHLSPDRQRVLCRVQRDVYATEYLIWDFETPVILDRVLALPYRYQVLAADATGVPLPDVLVSAWYPVEASDRLARPQFDSPAAVSFELGVQVLDLGSESLATMAFASPVDGIYAEPVTVVDLGQEGVGGSFLSPPTANYASIVEIIQLSSDALASSMASPPTAAYDLIVTVLDLDAPQYPDDALSTTHFSSPTGGTYEQP